MTEDTISPERPLREYGLDSLRSFELRNLLESAFGSRIPATAVWRHNTVRAIAGYCRTLGENGAGNSAPQS
jgi:acyl carrier protein